jgi:hypothetical protein
MEIVVSILTPGARIVEKVRGIANQGQKQNIHGISHFL